MRPLISVIIPVYNHAHTMERSLLSLAKQTYRPLEVIIVNDGSTDDFFKVMRQMQHKEPIKSLPGKVISQTNQGAAVARNHGFSESTGQFVIFWDADTVARPEMLEKMMAVLLVHDKASYVYCRHRFGWKRIASQHFNAKDLLRYNYIDATSLIRRQDFPGFDSTLDRLQDWNLWLTLLENNKTGIFLPETLYAKLVGGRKGISAWIPFFAYRLPWKTKKVRDYYVSRDIIIRKHPGLTFFDL